jgi:lipopolysaccharide/colanic/teichoic acid biosynthesis glycosyltransferase
LSTNGLVGPLRRVGDEFRAVARVSRARQVSGRSDIASDACRLDQRHVGTSSLTFDMLIVRDTFRAALGGSGAN